MGEAAFPVERRFGSGFESSKQKVLNTEKKTKDDCVRRDVTDTDGTRPNDPAALSLSLSLSFSVVHSRFIFLFQRVSVCGASRAMRCDAANDPRPGVPFPATNGRHRPMPHRKKAKKNRYNSVNVVAKQETQ